MKKNFFKRIKKGFTLIEMLIVIVIIGILAAALIPRLSSARGRANDTARKADLQQTAAAIVAYQIDHGTFPDTAGTLSGISSELTSAGMASIPRDPNASRTFSGIAGITAGQYGYTPISKGGISANGFVLMAGTETAGGSNWVVTNNGSGIANITSTTDFAGIVICKTVTADTTTTNDNGDCTYVQGTDVLRYIYVY